MFSLSVPSQSAFPVLFPTFLHSSLPWFHHRGTTALFSVFLLSVHIYLGQRLSGYGTGRLGMWEEEVATVCLYGSVRCHQEKHTLLSLDFLAHALRSHVKLLRAGNPKSIATSCIMEEEEELHAAQLRLHGHVPEQLLWHRDTHPKQSLLQQPAFPFFI